MCCVNSARERAVEAADYYMSTVHGVHPNIHSVGRNDEQQPNSQHEDNFYRSVCLLFLPPAVLLVFPAVILVSSHKMGGFSSFYVYFVGLGTS